MARRGSETPLRAVAAAPGPVLLGPIRDHDRPFERPGSGYRPDPLSWDRVVLDRAPIPSSGVDRVQNVISRRWRRRGWRRSSAGLAGTRSPVSLRIAILVSSQRTVAGAMPASVGRGSMLDATRPVPPAAPRAPRRRLPFLRTVPRKRRRDPRRIRPADRRTVATRLSIPFEPIGRSTIRRPWRYASREEPLGQCQPDRDGQYQRQKQDRIHRFTSIIYGIMCKP